MQAAIEGADDESVLVPDHRVDDMAAAQFCGTIEAVLPRLGIDVVETVEGAEDHVVAVAAERAHIDAFAGEARSLVMGRDIEDPEEVAAMVGVGQSATHEAEPVDTVRITVVAVCSIGGQGVEVFGLGMEMLLDGQRRAIQQERAGAVAGHADVAVGTALHRGDDIADTPDALGSPCTQVAQVEAVCPGAHHEAVVADVCELRQDQAPLAQAGQMARHAARLRVVAVQVVAPQEPYPSVVAPDILPHDVVDAAMAHIHIDMLHLAAIIELQALLAADIEGVAHSQQTGGVLDLRQDALKAAVPRFFQTKEATLRGSPDLAVVALA